MSPLCVVGRASRDHNPCSGSSSSSSGGYCSSSDSNAEVDGTPTVGDHVDNNVNLFAVPFRSLSYPFILQAS